MKFPLASLLVTIALFTTASFGQTKPTTAWTQLGTPAGDGWTGVKPIDGALVFDAPGQAAFRFPDGPRGFYKLGFRVENDGTVDLASFYGVRVEVRPDDDRELELTVTVAAVGPGRAVDKTTATTVRVVGNRWHAVTLPWDAFDFEQAGSAFLQFGKGVTVAARFADGRPGRVSLRGARLVKGPAVAMEAAVLGKAVPNDAEATYAVTVRNTTDAPQSVVLSFVRYGWEAMEATVEPANLQLAAGESRDVTVRVKVGPRVPPGGHERQVLQAVGNGDASTARQLTLVTTSLLAHPYILHTPARWREVRDKVEQYDWAKLSKDEYVAKADKWVVPEVAKPPKNDPDDTYGPFLFPTQIEHDVMAAGAAWQLTGDKRHAEKVATFLRRLSDPAEGYAKTFRACNQGLVQEGHFFQHAAMGYDMIGNAGVLTDADREQIAVAFRLFMETIDRENRRGAINNWNLSEVTGAFYCALVMQDLAAAERFFSGPSGIRDQLAKGTMDDGWWYECSISYNMWCASEFTQAALAYQSFGVNFLHEWLPANFSTKPMLTTELSGGTSVDTGDATMKGKPFGMDPSLYGPVHRPYRTITDLWDGLLPFLDYRGVMFGVNDSTENKVAGFRPEVGGQPFELAYYAFRDPRYASIVKLAGAGARRDLLYGVPELPVNTPELFRDSAFADNVGLAMLRSQTHERPAREQIQAVLHYGTHGWAHGHFDRTGLLSLMRYGRSFYNPEMVWYSYEPYMYKFYVQTSVAKNMVVVDQKMQEATPGERRLFHTGNVMQATVVDATARWANPPYGGMVYDYVPVKTFAEKMWREGRSVPLPNDPPAYGTLTDFTEPIHQRRLMVVTDDYVLLVDHAKGDKEHTFESLLQMKGFKGIESAGMKHVRHDAQWNPDPVGSAQFVTDCDWYETTGAALARFEQRWGPGADNAGTRVPASEDGVLKLDVHTLWPPGQQIMVGTAPEHHEVEKRLYWTVRGDGNTLAEGKVGAWILGRGEVDVALEGVKELELETKTELAKKPTLFWAGGRIVTRDGWEIPLAQLPMKADNVAQPKEAGKDYFGGPVKVVGTSYDGAVPAEPQDAKRAGVVRVDLSGVDAVRLKVVVGSDYPLGDESQRRKTFAVRARGTAARFVTVIEPYEADPRIKSATATDADTVRVELRDGRVQEITIGQFEGDGGDIKLTLKETKDGRVVRSETAGAGQ